MRGSFGEHFLPAASPQASQVGWFFLNFFAATGFVPHLRVHILDPPFAVLPQEDVG